MLNGLCENNQQQIFLAIYDLVAPITNAGAPDVDEEFLHTPFLIHYSTCLCINPLSISDAL